MLPLSNRNSFDPTTIYRTRRPSTSKIIFISCEGSITEECYFDIVSNIFSSIKSKIQFISVREDINRTPTHLRTKEQIKELGKSQPRQLMERIDQFKVNKESTYNFKKHPEDEFWIVVDVDHHTDVNYIDEWNGVLNECEEKLYGYAVSNPFFEFWLCLHHLDANEEDFKHAVTNINSYKPTSHYRERLRIDAKAPLLDKKKPREVHYDEQKIRQAIKRAKELHVNKEEKWPYNLGSTVYILLEKIVEML